MSGVIISPNIKRESVRIDPSGNVIDPRTKRVIEKKEAEYVPLPQELVSTTAPDPQIAQPLNVNTLMDPLSIQTQIDQAKANLAKLEELKKLKIAEMKAQIELLEK